MSGWSTHFYIDPAAEQVYCDNWPDCTNQITVILPVPEHHRKPGGAQELYLCAECADGQEQTWAEEDDAAREYEHFFGFAEVKHYAEKHGA